MDEFFSLDVRLDYSQNPDIVHSVCKKLPIRTMTASNRFSHVMYHEET